MRTIYEELRQRGLTGSEREFSRDWLRRSANHLADTRGSLSVETAIRLYVKLAQAGHGDLAASVWKEIMARTG